MDRRIWIAVAICLASTVGCHNTAQGVKADTSHALEKTGDKVHQAGEKIDDDK